jgi:hypothetical protein
MTTKLAKAYPRKHFFFEMFTRDLSLEDCILDLIDNSIDGLVRSRGIDIAGSLLNGGATPIPINVKMLPKIEVSYTDKEFKIEDTCGGIARKDALEDVFNFGHAEGDTGGSLGVYGIGLKRAIFKIGNHFEMESRTAKEGFSVDLNVKKWSEDDEDLEDWRIPISLIGGAPSEARAGTKIKVTALRPEVVMRINDGVLAQRLHSTISQTYGLFLNKFVQIYLNGTAVEPFHIPIGESDNVKAAHDEFREGDVLVKLFASLAERDTNGEWPADRAGWYALCNGRVVLAADKSDLTGWGVLGSPVWHAGKHRGFVGVAFFQSTNALALPWTTTKRGLNRESGVYQKARNMMKGVAKPILTFLDSMYKNEIPEEASAREIANQVKGTSLANVAAKPVMGFDVKYPARRAPKTTVSVCYPAKISEVDRVKKHLNKHYWGANKVGEYTFNYFLKTECPE